jgi:hypothetical protein
MLLLGKSSIYIFSVLIIKMITMTKKQIILFSLFIFFITSLLLTVKPIDTKTYKHEKFYEQTQNELNLIATYTHARKRALRVGWAKGNFTPDKAQRLSGYGIRAKYSHVADSSFVRVFAFDDGMKKGVFLTFDLLIVHRDLRIAIENALKKENLSYDFLFFSATHTHHGTSGWASGLGGLAVSGYDENVMQKITESTVLAIKSAFSQLSPCKISYQEIKTDSLVENRVQGDAYKDEMLRWVIFENAQQKKAILTTFAAHATSLSSDFTGLSGDYPAALRAKLEENAFDMAVFAAGGMASHAPICPEDTVSVKLYGEKLAGKILLKMGEYQIQDSLFSLRYEALAIKMRRPQFRLNDDFAVNPSIFEAVLGEMTGKINFLQIGKMVFMGYPCDISGEFFPLLKPIADSVGVQLLMTSFNGDYVGYVSNPIHFDKKHVEIRDMNWLGQDAGYFFVEISKDLLKKIAKEK